VCVRACVRVRACVHLRAHLSWRALKEKLQPSPILRDVPEVLYCCRAAGGKGRIWQICTRLHGACMAPALHCNGPTWWLQLGEVQEGGDTSFGLARLFALQGKALRAAPAVPPSPTAAGGPAWLPCPPKGLQVYLNPLLFLVCALPLWRRQTYRQWLCLTSAGACGHAHYMRAIMGWH